MSARDESINVIEVMAEAMWRANPNDSGGHTDLPGAFNRHKKADLYRHMAKQALEALKEAWADPSYDEDDPNAGHRFKISVQSAGSSSVVGDTDHTDDADGFRDDDVPLEVTVRAWNLRDALLLSLGVPLNVWAEGRVKYERDLDDGLAHPPYDYTETPGDEG